VTASTGSRESHFEFRPLTLDDLPIVVTWLSEPHVAAWWGEPLDLAAVEQMYGPCIDGSDPTLVYVIETRRGLIGMIQTYRLRDNPEYEAAIGVEGAAGLDLLIGDPDLLGHGLGTEVIRRFVTDVIWPTYPDVDHVVAGPSVRNTRSQRAFEKAGFYRSGAVTVPGEIDDEMVMVARRPGKRSG
jgi:aminoglycoside 6'-N-acetyltransferase